MRSSSPMLEDGEGHRCKGSSRGCAVSNARKKTLQDKIANEKTETPHSMK